jgi:hypothetical protein
MGWRSASRPGDPAFARRCAIFAASGHGVQFSSGVSFAENFIERHPIDSRFRDDERARFYHNGAEPGVETPESIGRNKLLQTHSTFPQCGLGACPWLSERAVFHH